jgi:putative endonuclease
MKKDEFGRLGENAAAEHIRRLNYIIIARNWKRKPYEIDIIAKHEEKIVIVEVKTRRSDDFGDPQDFVSRKKQGFLVKAAQIYAEEHHIEEEIRFDVVAVIINQSETRIRLIQNAFIPLLGM